MFSFCTFYELCADYIQSVGSRTTDHGKDVYKERRDIKEIVCKVLKILR